jgi:hypothetical protein
MRWLRIRRAAIPPERRDLFERLGAPVISLAITSGFHAPAPQLHPLYDDSEVRNNATAWLTEQYDRAERKETWSLTMEAAITIFVAVELALSAVTIAWHYGWLRSPPAALERDEGLRRSEDLSRGSRRAVFLKNIWGLRRARSEAVERTKTILNRASASLGLSICPGPGAV